MVAESLWKVPDERKESKSDNEFGAAFIENKNVSSLTAFRRLSTEQQGILTEKIMRRSSTETTSKDLVKPGPSDSLVSGKGADESSTLQMQDNHFSELELLEIKKTFWIIETLWRDISMGSDSIMQSMMTSIHLYLGEIGSELFKRLFMNNTVSQQVMTIP